MRRRVRWSEERTIMGTGKRALEKMRAVMPVVDQRTTSLGLSSWTTCQTPLARAEERLMVLRRSGGGAEEVGASWDAMYCSVVPAMWFMTWTAPTGNLPTEVSPESMTASVRSKMALATSETSARVGEACSI